MSTIPASAFVNVLPGVISAGGASIILNGLMLTNSWRVPVGAVQSFVSAAAVGAFFGLSSNEYAKALNYFGGYVGATQVPGQLLIAQYPQAGVAAWLKGASVAALTIAQLAALSGSLNITVDGYVHSAASLNLSGATSFSAAAALIQTALNTTEPTEASVTGSIAAVTSTFTASIADEVMTVTGSPSNPLVAGAILTGGAVAAGTQILSQISGAAGLAGTYAVSIPQNLPSTSLTATYGTLTVTAVGSGTVSVGQTVTGAGVTAGTAVTALGTGTGLAGTYFVNLTQTVTSEALVLVASNLTVTYDSVSGGFVITSGIIGSASAVAYATGTLAAPLMLTSVTGATLSQGANGQTPSAFMASVVAQQQNWASYFLSFDPDDGNGNAQKLLFCAWTSAQNNRYAFICWDTDVTPTLSNSATASLGYLIGPNGANYVACCLIYDPNNTGVAAFVSGSIAAVNFGAFNGRVTFSFRSQAGLIAVVSTQQAWANLIANGYNSYVVDATASQQFTFLSNGQISGPFQWLDSFINQIWMNSNFQNDLMNLLISMNSIPYTNVGYAMVEAALMTDIKRALDFGAIRAGVPLSSSEILIVNTQAGFPIDTVISARGWYLQVQPASPTVRQARSTPTCYFWYADGQSIQQITLNSLLIQ